MAHIVVLTYSTLLLPAISTQIVFNTAETKLKSLSFDFVKESTSEFDILSLISRLTEELKDLQRKVSSLENLETRVEELEKQLNKKCVEVNGGTITENNQTDDGDQLEPQEIEFQRLEQNRESVIDESTVNRRSGIRKTPGLVAFSAVVSRPLDHIPEWQIIKFDKTIHNTGNGYNATSGLFTPPTSGTYLFLYHLGHYGDGETWVELMKNGKALNGVGLKGTAYNQYLQGSNSAVTHVEVGESVWVESYHVPDASVQGEFTTFSGVLLDSN